MAGGDKQVVPGVTQQNKELGAQVLPPEISTTPSHGDWSEIGKVDESALSAIAAICSPRVAGRGGGGGRAGDGWTAEDGCTEAPQGGRGAAKGRDANTRRVGPPDLADGGTLARTTMGNESMLTSMDEDALSEVMGKGRGDRWLWQSVSATTPGMRAGCSVGQGLAR